MSRVCPDCYGIPDFFDARCPTCAGKGYLGSRQAQGGRQFSGTFLSELESKLASQDWGDMVRRVREQIGLPAQGLEPDEAGEFFHGSLMNLIMSYAALHPRIGPQMSDQMAAELPGQISDLSDDELDRGVRAILMGSPEKLLRLRFAAAHLGWWLGLNDHESVMLYLISSQRWPLDNVSPKSLRSRGLRDYQPLLMFSAPYCLSLAPSEWLRTSFSEDSSRAIV